MSNRRDRRAEAKRRSKLPQAGQSSTSPFDTPTPFSEFLKNLDARYELPDLTTDAEKWWEETDRIARYRNDPSKPLDKDRNRNQPDSFYGLDLITQDALQGIAQILHVTFTLLISIPRGYRSQAVLLLSTYHPVSPNHGGHSRR